MRAAALLMLLGAAPAAPAPRATPPLFATVNYGLTFRSPPASYYCPLPDGWRGSDHGTTIFLRRPAACGIGFGYPSTTRDFAPGDTPRIEIFYAFALDPEDKGPPEKCTLAGRVMLFGASRKLCVTHDHGMSIYSVDADYRFDSTATLNVRLLTIDRRGTDDLATLRRFLVGVQACHSKTWATAHRRDRSGVLPACPRSAQWY